ncbi:MAG: sigma-70 family RNA polymerase sigma factor [Planctomycetes bacterium]|nr:sigma-70 family RNA polymerase sigma factor [Planctomycetota bacterium]MCC7172654.1 sigma-70 family RNA polymerase sigma factor [Planctomycetota bacterium]
MRDLEPDHLFERYRRFGDTAALAALFDHSAPELLKLARLLVRDRSLADDLLQATFVTAIEKAQWFDGSRRIEPWLVGILAKHAANARRKQNRFLDADRLDRDAPTDPHTDAERREFAAEVERALSELPTVYREVLEPRLRHDRRGDDIARALGRKPGVVRMQIARGMALLKQMLPHGLTALTLGALLSRRSLAAARHAVLEHAVAHAPAPIAASAAQTAAASVVGGIVVSKLPVISVAALVLAASAWFVLHDEDVPPALVTTTNANAVAHAESNDGAVSVPPIATPSGDAFRSEVSSARIDDLDVPRATWPAAVDPDLARIEGRVLESDGSPVAGVEVTLFEVDFKSWVGVLDSRFGVSFPAHVELAHGRTDADGRFVVTGANASTHHALGIDAAGTRSTVRVVDQTLRAGSTNDIGDFVLTKGVEVSGTVVDDSGEPVPGARVRIVPLPIPVGATGIQHTMGSSVFLRQDSRAGNPSVTVMTQPPWLERLIDRPPLPTTTSGLDGAFRFPAVPVGTMSVVVDHRDFVASVVGPFPSGTSGHDIGAIRLDRGRTIRGTVIDSLGHPVKDAEVVVGVVPEVGTGVVAQRCERTDAAGHFEVSRVPEFHDVLAAARRSTREPWTASAAEDVDEVTIELPARATLELVVLDSRGSPVIAPRLHLRPMQEARFEAALLGFPGGLVVDVESSMDGHHLLRDVPPGQFELTIRAEGFAMSSREIVVSDGVEPIEIRLTDERVITLRVLAAEGGGPIEAARTSVFENGSGPAANAVTRGFTDASGLVTLHGLRRDEPLVLIVDRPGFAEIETLLPADSTEFELTMHRGGSIDGAVLLSGSPPSDPLMISVQKRGRRVQAMPVVPMTALTDGRGNFGVHGLPDGEYKVEIRQRLLSGEPASWIERVSAQADPLYEASIDVKAGESSRLDVHLVAPGSQGKAAVRGRVTIDGEPHRTAMIELGHPKGNEWIEVDDRGEFVVESLMPGPANLRLLSVTKTDDGHSYHELLKRSFTLAAGQTQYIEFDLVSTTVRVHVRTAEGGPVEGAMVRVSGNGPLAREIFGVGRSDASGTAEVRVTTTADRRDQLTLKFHVTADHDQFGEGYISVDLPQADVDIVLDPGIPCSGSFTVGPGIPLDPAMSHHLDFLPSIDTADAEFRSITLTSPSTRTFLVTGMEPGEYSVTFRCGPNESAPFVFTLPPEGATDLAFEFQRAK